VFRSAILVASLATACGSPAPKAADAKATTEPARPTELVRLSALADATAVGPGQELTIAARLDIAPGWHVYWVNPGESGLATDVTVSAPTGFEVGELQFPGPMRFETGGVVSFGYAERVLVSTRVTAPDDLTTESTFDVGAEWLACNEECIRGQAHTQLRLPLATAAAPAAPTNQHLIDEHRRRLPRPLAELANARYDWRPTEGGQELVVYVDGGQTVEFFPYRELQTALVGQALVPGEGVGALHLSFRNPLPTRIRGVLRAADATSAYFFALDLPLPE